MRKKRNENGGRKMEGHTDPFEPDPATAMRGELYADKTIAVEGNIEIMGDIYYRRVFTDGCTELVRYNGKTKMWAVLCFPNEDRAR
jgi:hypothetical protein